MCNISEELLLDHLNFYFIFSHLKSLEDPLSWFQIQFSSNIWKLHKRLFQFVEYSCPYRRDKAYNRKRSSLALETCYFHKQIILDFLTA